MSHTSTGNTPPRIPSPRSRAAHGALQRYTYPTHYLRVVAAAAGCPAACGWQLPQLTLTTKGPAAPLNPDTAIR